MSELQRYDMRGNDWYSERSRLGDWVDAGEAADLIANLRQRIEELESNVEVDPMHMLHKLWTMCVGTPGYNKAAFSDVERQVLSVIRRKEEVTSLNSVAAGAARAYTHAQAGEVVKPFRSKLTKYLQTYGVGRKIDEVVVRKTNEIRTEPLTVQSLIDLLKLHEPTASVRFSIADDDSPDDGERWFAEEGIEGCFGDKLEVTICLVARSNMKD